MVASDLKLDKLKQSVATRLLFGNDPTPELIAILTVYFVQGILGLSRLAVSFFLKDDLGLSPAQVSALVGVAALPWVVKPLFGFLSDGLPLFNYRRRSYLVLSGLLGAIAWLALASVVHNALSATLAMLLASLSVAIADVIADSLVVERVRGESYSEAGSLQALTWGTAALGGLITAYLSGWLLERVSTQVVFAIVASFPLLVAAMAWFIVEEPVSAQLAAPHDAEPDEPGQLRRLWQAVRQPSIWLPTAFVFLWQATPSSDSALFFFMTNELHFAPEFLGRVRLVVSLAALVGVWLYHRFLRWLPFRVILGWTTLLSSLLGLTTLLLVTHTNRSLGIDDHWFSLGDSLILTVMGQIAFMPVLVLAARLCPPGIEATMFALLMSIWNLAGLLSHETGALLTHWLGVTETEFGNLWLLVLIANLSSLLPLPFLHWLPSQDEEARRDAQRALAQVEPSTSSLSTSP